MIDKPISRFGFRRSTLFVAFLATFFLVVAGTTSFAAIVVNGGIGVAGDGGTGTTSLAVGVTSAVAVNNTVIVAVTAYNPNGRTFTVTDASGNTYTQNATVTDTQSTITMVFSAPVTTALTTSSTIHVNSSGTINYINASAFSVNGLVIAASPVDQTAIKTGTSTAASVGPTALTTEANELLVGAFGLDLASSGTPTFAVGSGYTALPTDVINGTWGIYPEYQIVSATGTYSAAGTFSGDVSDWSAAIVTYESVGPATKLVFTSGAVTTTAGAASTSITVTREDQFGDPVTSGTTSVTLSSSSSGTVTYTPASPLSIGSGSSSVTFTYTDTKAGTPTVTAASSGLASGTQVETVNPGTPSQLVMDTEPSTVVTAGAAFGTEPSVYVEDKYGNIETTDGTSHVTVGVQTGTPPMTGTTTVTVVAGVAMFSGLDAPAIAQTGLKLQFTDTGDSLSALNDTTSIMVNPGLPATLTMAQQPSTTATAGAAFAQQPIVTVKDQFGNLVADGTIITATETSGGNLNGVVGGITAVTTSGQATFSGLFVTNAGTVTLTFTANGHSVASGNITVSAASATQFVITGSTAETAGVSQNITITAADPYGNTDPTYTGSHNLTFSGASSSPNPPTQPTVNNSTGTPITFGGLTAINFINGVASVPAPAIGSPTQIAQTTSTTSGTSFPITTTATVATGNTIIVTVSYTASSSSLPTISVTDGHNTYTQNAVSVNTVTPFVNTAVFSAPVATALAGGTITVNFSSAVTDKNGNAFYVSGLGAPLPADQSGSGTGGGTKGTTATVTTTGSTTEATELVVGAIGIAAAPSSASVGTGYALIGSYERASTVVGLLAEYQTVSATGPYSATGTWTGSENWAASIVTYKAAIPSGNGVMTLYDAQLATVSVTDGTVTSSGGVLPVTVSPASVNKLAMKTEPSTPVTVGGVFGTQPAVYIEDQYGNVVTTDTSTVTATVGSGTGSLTGTLTAVDSGGAATFSGLAAPQLAQTGLKLTFTDGSLISVADTTSITVNPGLPAALSMAQQPSTTATAGVAFVQQPIVTVKDQFGNLVANGTIITATETSGGNLNSVMGGITAVTASGQVSFSGLFVTNAGTVTLTFTANGHSVASGNITVSAASATQFVITGSTAETAGVSQNITITAADPYGNTDPTYTGSHNLTFSGASSSPNPPTQPTVNNSTGTPITFGGLTAINFINGVATINSPAIGTPTQLAGNTSTGSGKTVVITVPSGSTVPTGNTVIVTVSYESATPGTIGVTDSKGNTYHEDGFSANTTVSPNVNTAIFSAPVTTALANPNTITVTFGNSVTGRDANAFYVSGLLSSSPADQTASGFSTTTGTTATAGPTGNTVQATELLVGAIATGSGPTSVTHGTGYTGVGAFLDPSGSVTLFSEYQAVNATGPYSATGTWTPAEQWSASIVTYKALPPSANVPMTLYDAQSATISVTDGTVTSTNGVLPVTVSPASANKLVFTTEPPASTAAGSAMTPFVVQVEDAYGNAVSDSGVAVTLTPSSGSIASGGSANTPSGGAATFSGTIMDTAVPSATFTASATSLISGTSSSFSVTGGTATEMIVTLPGQTFTSGSGVTGTPSTQTAGTAFNILKLTAVDNFKNIDTTYSGSIIITYSGPANSPNNTAPTYTTTVSFTAGQSTTTLTTTLFDAQSSTAITATDGSLIGVASTPFTVNPHAASQLVYTSVPSTGVAGTAFSVTVASEDAWGNLSDPSANTTISLTKVAGGGTLSGGPGTIPTTASSVTISGIIYSKSDTMTLKAAATAGASLGSVTSGNIVFSPGAINSYSVSVTTALPLTRGETFNFTVTALDGEGNPVTTDSSTVVTMTDSTGNMNFSSDPVTLSGGTFSVSASDDYFETDKIIATDGTGKTGNTTVTIDPANGDYRSNASANWGTASTWQVWNSTTLTWGAASSAPTSTTTNEIMVTNNDTVNVASSVTAQNLVVVVGSTVMIANSQIFTVYNGLAYGTITDGNLNNGILVESGAGNSLTLLGNNSYGGGTLISAGTLVVTNVWQGTGIQNLGNGPLTFDTGGTLDDVSAVPAGNVQYFSNIITLNAGGGVLVQSSASGNTIVLTNTVTGSGGLITGGSDLILGNTSHTGNNAIGAITNFSGRLFVNSLGSINSSSITEDNGAILDFQISGGVAPVNKIVFMSGAGVSTRLSALTLSTATTTFPSAGTMIFDQDDDASDAVTVNGNYPTLTGPLTIQIGSIDSTVGAVTFNGAISGSYGITKTSIGELIFASASASTYTGGTMVSAGHLDASVANSVGTGDVLVSSGATFEMDSATAMSSSARLILSGASPLVNLTYGHTGSTTQHITGLSLNDGTSFEPAGVYGGSGSGATAGNQSSLFEGSGNVTVGNFSAITVTAKSNTKPYDGTTTAATTPTITSGSLVGNDTATLEETYDTPNVGMGKTLTPTASITDSLGIIVTGDYTITLVSVTTGIITPTAMPVATAATLSRGKNTDLLISVTNFLSTYASDNSGDTMSLYSVDGFVIGSTGVLGTTTSGTSIYYTSSYNGSAYLLFTPAPGNNNPETFPYVVQDSSFSSYSANSTITLNTTNATGQMSGSIAVTGSSVTTKWFGIPGDAYVVQRSTSLNGTYTDVSGVLTASTSDGSFTFVDNSPPAGNAFYQLRQN